MLRSRLLALKRLALAQHGLVLVWLVLTALALVPVWHQRLLPMLDTPNHLALARGWHNFHDPDWHISDYYVLRIRAVPYFLFYLSIHLLLYVFSIEVANKIFLSLYLILFPLSVLSLARALKRSPWLALGAFALAFNQNWIYGFSSYLMSTVFFFFSLAALLRWLDEGRQRTLVWLLASCALCYFSHILSWFCFGLCAIAILLLEWRNWRRGLLAAAALSPTVALALAAWLEERAERTYMKTDAFTALWRDFPTSVMEFPRRVMELFPGSLDNWVLATVALTVIGLLLWKGVKRGELADERVTLRLRWVLIMLGLAWLSLPYNITKPMSWWYVSPRLPSLMAPVLLLLPSVSLVSWRRFLLLPMIAMSIALPLQLARLYRDFSNRNAPFMRLVAELPLGAKTMVVARGMMRGSGSEEKSGDPTTSAPVYWHFSSWPMALKGGYDPYIFDQGIPIRPKALLKAPPWGSVDTFDIRQAPDFDYYIVRLPLESMDREPSLKLIDEANEWKLYKRVYDLTDEP